MPNPPEERTAIYSDLVQAEPSFAEIVELFVQGLPERLAAFEKALEASDFDAVRQLAHRLKGSGGGHGYAVLTEKAAVLEQSAKNGELEAIRRDMAELQELISRVRVQP